MAVSRLLLQALPWVDSLLAPPGRYTSTLVRAVLSRVSMDAGRPLQSGAWTHRMSMSSASTAWWVGEYEGVGAKQEHRARDQQCGDSAGRSRRHRQQVMKPVWQLHGGVLQHLGGVVTPLHRSQPQTLTQYCGILVAPLTPP